MKAKQRETYDKIEPTSKDLKMLDNVSAYECAKNWIYNMVHLNSNFPQFMYQDMFLMKDFTFENTSSLYFYIGYYPSDIRTIHGPYYIGAFELKPRDREFITHVIIQNPNYMIENDLDKYRFIDFKRELVKMTQDALVFFKYANLKNTANERYYYSWLFEDI